MRIACVHVPQLSLQCVTRVEPSLRAAALVVAGSGPGALASSASGRTALSAPIVLAVSRAAWALGVRLGMTAVAARAVSPDVRVVHGDPAGERDVVRALADALLAVTPAVDLGGRLGAGGAHLAMYLEVPARLRGASFGERVIEVIERLGLSARVGIADDRFTAWVAASQAGEQLVTSVPRGGAAAFLANKPLALLAITPEVQHMLEALGVRTLGEFAALPAPSVSRPVDRDYQALARGEGGTSLRTYAPDAAIREEISLGGLEAGLNNVQAVEQIARRIALRLAGRARFASRLEVLSIGGRSHVGATGAESLATIDAPRALASEEQLAEAIAPAIAAGSWRVRVTVAGEATTSEVGDLDATDAAIGAAIGAGGAASTPPVDMIGVVLSGSGTGDLFAAYAPGGGVADERRHPERRHQAYRRTRRGKQRKRIVAASVQPRLFERS